MTPYRCLRPALFALDAEQAHGLTLAAAALAARLPGGLAALSAANRFEHPALAIETLGMRFSNPLGLAAGFDKDGTGVAPLAALGFGFLELGTVTPRPQPGNPRPRLFRLPEDEAVINRLGFNNRGASALAARLAALPVRPIPLGVNLGKNRDTSLERAAEDYVAAFRAVHGVADYVVVNVSSPNTPGLRSLQGAAELRTILRAVLAERDALESHAESGGGADDRSRGPGSGQGSGRGSGQGGGRGSGRGSGHDVPLLVKIAPDLAPADLEATAQAALECGVDGLIATNTTLRREGLHGDGVPGAPLRSAARTEAGGLSGRPLLPLALDTVRRLHGLLRGRIPLIGVGGIAGAADAYAFLCAGATLVQLYTGLVYQGPGLVRRIKQDLVRLLARDGLASVAAAVGSGRH